MSLNKRLNVFAVTVPITDLDPELANFYSCLQITPAITKFHDKDSEDQSNPDLCVSNRSSDIEEEKSKNLKIY
jgi:hypothetical protein